MPEYTNPGFPDDQWQSMVASHEADVAWANVHDPKSVFYNRPDLVKAHVDTAEAAFRDIVERAAKYAAARTPPAASDTTKPSAPKLFSGARRPA